MRASRLIVTISMAVVFAASAAAPAIAKDKWINLKSKNFNIVSNASEGDTRKLALKLEQFRAAFSEIFNIKSVASLPITVIAFKSDGAFKPFKPLYNGKPANVSGYFQPSQDENIIALDVSANSIRPMAVIYHEYTHFLTSRTPREWPVWLSEGLAELYSTFEAKKEEVNLGIPIADHVHLLRQEFMPLQALINVTHNSPAYNERNTQTIFYAESWALTHYLMFGDKGVHQPQLVQFLRLYYSGIDEDKAFSLAFKTDFAAMEKALKKYVQNNTYTISTLDLKKFDVPTDMAVQPLDEGEVQYYLGDLLLQTNRPDEAAEFFNRAAALDPKMARPYEGLGFVAIRHQDYSRAQQELKQAIDRGSQDFLAHYYYAEAVQRQAFGSRATIFGGEAAKTIIDELKKSISLGSAFPYSYFMLAQAYLLTRQDENEGIKAIKTAIQLAPQNKHFYLVLAELQVQTGDYDGARSTLSRLASDPDPFISSQAASIKQRLESYSRYATRSDEKNAGDSRSGSVGASDSDSQKLARRPVLIRRDTDKPAAGSRSTESGSDGAKTGPAASDSSESRQEKTESRSQNASHQGPAAPAGQAVEASGRGPSGRPLLNVPGAKVLGAFLVAIECENGMGLVAARDGKLLRFTVSEPAKLKLVSQDPGLHLSIGCGPIKRPVFIHYKPAPDGQSQVTGDAVAVEFTK